MNELCHMSHVTETGTPFEKECLVRSRYVTTYFNVIGT